METVIVSQLRPWPLLFSYIVQRYENQGSESVLHHELIQLWRKMSCTENLEKNEWMNPWIHVFVRLLKITSTVLSGLSRRQYSQQPHCPDITNLPQMYCWVYVRPPFFMVCTRDWSPGPHSCTAKHSSNWAPTLSTAECPQTITGASIFPAMCRVLFLSRRLESMTYYRDYLKTTSKHYIRT